MQINNKPTFQFLNSLTSSTNTDKSKSIQTHITSSNSKQASNNYNVRNMTPTEFQGMINDLRQTGQISEKDSMMLTLDRLDMERFHGKDTKLNMIDFYEGQVQFMKSPPGSTGIEIMERSLEILKGVEAKNNTVIPNSV